MFDNGRRLDVGAFTVDENRNLTPARICQKFRRLVHAVLKADIAERERLADRRSISATL
jgi:hypothetical protein